MDPQQSVGLASFLAQTNALGKALLAILLVMSIATWYLIITKTITIVLERRKSARFLETFWDAPSLASSSPRASASPSPRRSSPPSHLTARPPSGAASPPRHSSPPLPLPPRRIKQRGSAVAAPGSEQACELGNRIW